MGPLKAIGAFGLSVMVLTIGIRAVLFPVFGWQLRTSRRIQAEQRLVAPQLQELRKKYKKEPQRLSQEMNALYKEHGISPFSSLTGCIPALVQMPVLIGLYQSIRAFTNGGTGVISPGTADSSGSRRDRSRRRRRAARRRARTASSNVFDHPALLILPILAGAFTFAQSRMMMPPPRPDMSDQERSMQGVTKQMSFIFPVMIFAFSFLFPQGLAIYWVTGTMFMVAQQYHLLGWNGLEGSGVVPGRGARDRADDSAHPARPAKTGAREKSTTGVVAKNGAARTASRNGTSRRAPGHRGRGQRDQAGGATTQEPRDASQSAQARSLARTGTRPNRPNRRRRRR